MSTPPNPKFKPATSIQEVIDRLDEIIQQSIQKDSRVGYFAALYREVTANVRDGIDEGFFEDGVRMERLDKIFANRYLEALHQFENNRDLSESWRYAFNSTTKWRLLILQQLLLGMNAHINLDLGIAAVQASAGNDLQDLRNDFFKINEILSSLTDDIQKKINTLSPLLGWLDKIGGRTDEAMMNFSIDVARDEAWKFAVALGASGETIRAKKISEKDDDTESLSDFIANPGWLLNIGVFFIRLFETKNIDKAINVLFRKVTT